MKINKYALMALLLVGSAAVNAAEYVSVEPIKKIGSGWQVGDVSEGTQQLPVITWGGDIATWLANGMTASTGDGLFKEAGLEFNIERQDAFVEQLESYVTGKTPYLRGTIGMLSQALPLLQADPRTNPVIIYQLTWSTGGDCLVVKDGIESIADLRGKTIVLQAYGPHVDLLTKVLSDAGLTLADVTIKWVADLTGTENTPLEAFYADDVDAAFCIIPDGLVLTSDGTVGTGKDDSVKGAKISFSTADASRVIADVYAVRQDYYEANQKDVQKFVHALLKAEEELRNTMTAKSGKYEKLLSSSAQLLLDTDSATEDIKGLYADCSFVGYTGNVDFLTSDIFPRRLSVVASEIQKGLLQLRLVDKQRTFTAADFDFADLSKGLIKTNTLESTKFDPAAVQNLIAKKAAAGSLDSSAIIEFEIRFAPNQSTFDLSAYRTEFEHVVNMAATYGGAIITVEGHADPHGWLLEKAGNAAEVELKRSRQSLKNQSLSRATSVRRAIVEFAQGKGLDEGQFTVFGYGIDKPKTGVNASGIPNPIKTEEEWKSNRRVQIRVVPVAAEANVFVPIGG